MLKKLMYQLQPSKRDPLNVLRCIFTSFILRTNEGSPTATKRPLLRQ